MGHRGPLFSHFGTTLTSIWGYFGVILCIGRWLRATLGSRWGHSELSLGSLLAYEDDFGMVKMSSWAYEGQFLRNIHFPNGF